MRAIGIFDSGIGGLTVVRALRKLLPSEDLIYLGDTGRYPYGTKSADVVRRYSFENTEFLVDKGDQDCWWWPATRRPRWRSTRCRSAIAIPVVGVVEPGAQAAARTTRNRKVGVVATEGHDPQRRVHARAAAAARRPRRSTRAPVRCSCRWRKRGGWTTRWPHLAAQPVPRQPGAERHRHADPRLHALSAAARGDPRHDRARSAADRFRRGHGVSGRKALTQPALLRRAGAAERARSSSPTRPSGS